jgi:hypothetical protein
LKNGGKMELIKTIESLKAQIDTYHATPLSDGGTLVELAQNISVYLFFLSEQKTMYHDKYQKRLHQLVTQEKMNVNRAQNQCEVEVPELYRLRYFIRSGYEILNIIRTQVSYLKHESHQTRLT